MLTHDDITKIQELKGRGYSQSKASEELGISRSTVCKYWEKRLRLDDCFILYQCIACEKDMPVPTFLKNWSCPYCGKEYHITEPLLKPDTPNTQEGQEDNQE